jgi:hypothetical protein
MVANHIGWRPGAMQMLETIIIIILLMWVLGFSFHIAGGLIHLLLVVAVVVVLVRIIQGRRPV